MKEELYQQCRLVQDRSSMVTWIPVEGARVGNTMVLFDFDTKEQLSGRWEVATVYSATKTIQEAKTDARRYDKWRDHTDI